MRVCVLTDEDPEDFNPAPYLGGFDWQMVTLTDPVKDVLRNLAARNECDVYLNLCEGHEEGAEWKYQGIDVVRALEELNLPFTGADSTFFDPTREEMQAAGIIGGFCVSRPQGANPPVSVRGVAAKTHFLRLRAAGIPSCNSVGFWLADSSL